MTETLKPCPFCGGAAKHGIVTEGGDANPDLGGHFIQCVNERCFGCMGLRFACGDDPRPALRAAWNTRAPDDVAQIVAWLRGPTVPDHSDEGGCPFDKAAACIERGDWKDKDDG